MDFVSLRKSKSLYFSFLTIFFDQLISATNYGGIEFVNRYCI